MGEGSFGCATLWVKTDPATDRIVERIVTKDLLLGTVFANALSIWTDDPPPWMPNPRRILKEFFTQTISHRGPGPAAQPALRNHILQPLAWENDAPRTSARLYTEYADHGDLEDLVLRHLGLSDPQTAIVVRRLRSGTRANGGVINAAIRMLPEPFIVSNT